jgi:dipeptide/tripeptide permease
MRIRDYATTLVAGVYIELAGGNVYLFSLFSEELKAALFAPTDTSAQSKLQMMAFAANIGNYLPFAGFFYDSSLGGPRRTVLFGSVLTAVGYAGLYLCSGTQTTANGSKVSAAMAPLIVFCAMWGHGSGYLDTASVATNLKNLPHHSGLVVGLLKSFYGNGL